MTERRRAYVRRQEAINLGMWLRLLLVPVEGRGLWLVVRVDGMARLEPIAEDELTYFDMIYETVEL